MRADVDRAGLALRPPVSQTSLALPALDLFSAGSRESVSRSGSRITRHMRITLLSSLLAAVNRGPRTSLVSPANVSGYQDLKTRL